MKTRLPLTALLLSGICCPVQAEQTPHTSWGDPDLSGTWSNESLTPFERPPDAAEFISGEDAEAARTRIRDARQRDGADRTDIAPPPKGGNVGGYNLVWIDAGDDVVSSGRSSLVVSHDGRVPVRETALKKKHQHESLALGDMEYMSPWDRCVTRGIPGGMFQAGYNNYYRIEQTPDAILIYYEMIHESRIIPLDNQPRLGGGLQFWNGEPRGYWDGDTLVVESKAFKPAWIATSFSQARIKGVPSTTGLTVEERFTRTDRNTILWRVTVTDPEIYQEPWVVEVPMVNRAGAKIYEYACHEGNQAVANILKGARVQEQERGYIESLDPAFNALLTTDSKIEKIADGFQFVEGPVWHKKQLVFSDIPGDTIYTWSGKKNVQTLVKPVFLPELKTGGSGGSNGLALDNNGDLLIAEHGNRRIARLLPDGQRQTVAEHYNGKRLNSPNDMILHSSGAIFFTDPPYGLSGLEESPAKEQPHNGIYRLDTNGNVTLLATQTRPNGIGLSPDEKTLYVANSAQPPHRYWMAYRVSEGLTLDEGRIFHDANATRKAGVPDGLAVDRSGNLFATGPGGIWVLNAKGTLIGMIAPPERPANAAFGGDGQTLFMTARTGLYQIRLNTTGLLPRNP